MKTVKDYLTEQNLPIGIAENIYLIYKDSGKVTTKMRSPLLYDFSNRKEHPYSEFPQGLYITRIISDTDSITVLANYAISYTKTQIAEIRDEVVVVNYAKNYTLYTSQLFWDQKEHYYITDKEFTLITPSDTLYGVGFESNEDLTNWYARENRGSLHIEE